MNLTVGLIILPLVDFILLGVGVVIDNLLEVESLFGGVLLLSLSKVADCNLLILTINILFSN